MEKYIEKLNMTIKDGDILRLHPINSWDELGLFDPHHCRDFQYSVRFTDDGELLLSDTYYTNYKWFCIEEFIDYFKVGKATKLDLWFNTDDVIKVINPKEYNNDDLIEFSTQHGYCNKQFLVKKGTPKLSEIDYNDRIYLESYNKVMDALKRSLWYINELLFLDSNKIHSNNELHELSKLKDLSNQIHEILKELNDKLRLNDHGSD